MGRRNRKTRNKYQKTTSDVMRCAIHVKPVLEHESCDSFAPKKNSKGKRCSECNYSL
jgi:hypothetical protein